MTRIYGYPGVVGQRLPDAGAVSRTRIDGEPCLCVSYDVERRRVQPLRLAAALAVGYRSAWVWWKADTAMRTEP